MAALTEGTDYWVYESKAVGGKVLIVETVATVDDGDTLTVDLSKYGYSGLSAVFGFIHSTTNSVLVQEQPTTAVSASVATVTVGGSTDNKKRTYHLYGAQR
jgi:hypothetical protein